MTESLPAQNQLSDLDALLAEADWVKGLARSLLRDEWAALDLSQDVLHDAIKAPPALRGTRLRAWLGTIARRKLFRKLERERVRPSVESEGARPEASEPDAASRRVQLHMDLSAEIQGLDPADREVIVAFFLEGRPQADIAEEAGVSPASMRKRISRAKARLAERLAASPRGREGWTAGLLFMVLESVPPSAPLPGASSGSQGAAPQAATPVGAVTGSFFPLAAIAMKIAFSLVVVAALAIVFFGPLAGQDPSNAGDLLATLPESRASDLPEGSVESSTSLVSLATTDDARKSARITEEPARQASVETARFARVADPAGEPLSRARAAWLGSSGELQELEINEDGRVRIPGLDGGRLFAAAEGFLGRCVEVEEARASATDSFDWSVDWPVVLSISEPATGQVTVDGVAPGRELAIRQVRLAGDFGLLAGESSLESQLLALLGLKPGAMLRIDGNGHFAFQPQWELDELQFWLPLEFLVRSIDGREVESADSHLVLQRTGATHRVDLIQLPAVRGRLVWSDDQSPVTGHVNFMLRHGGNDQMTGTFLSDDGAFAVAPFVDRHRFDPLQLDLRSSTFEEEPIRVATRLRIALPSLGLGVVHETELGDAGASMDLGDIAVERDPEVRVLVRGKTSAGQGDPQPIRAVVRGSNGTQPTDAEGRVSLRLGHGDSLEAMAVGYRYREVFPSDSEIDQGEWIVIDLEPAPVLTVLTPVNPGLLLGDTAPKIRLSFDWTPFDTSELDAEDRGSPYDAALQRAVQGTDFLGGGWSHAKPGAPGTASLSMDSSGELALAGLVPGSSFRVELIDFLDQVLLSTNVHQLGIDGAVVDLRGGWEAQASELSLRVRWADGEPVKNGSVQVKGSAGRGSSFPFQDGEVLLFPLAHGPHSIGVSAPGAQTVTFEDFEVGSGSAQLEVTLIPE